MTKHAPPAPDGLSPVTAALWPGLVADLHALGTDAEVDLLQLREALLAADRLAAVRAAIDADGLTAAGSKGQPRAHPLLAAEASLRHQLADALHRLGLSPRDRGPYLVVRAGRLASKWPD